MDAEKANQKKELRRSFLQARLLMPQKEAEKHSKLICLNIFTNFFLLNKNIGIYHPIKNEVNPLFLTQYGIVNFSLPKIQNSQMTFKKWQIGEELMLSEYNILEPLETATNIIPEAILVPIVAFDRRRFRIGYGGGFYDKFLSNYQGLKLGLAFEMQQCKNLPEEKLDIKLDYIITEDNIY